MKRITLTAVLAVAASGSLAQATTKTTMANPAATFCVENDGEYQIRKNSDGSEYGVCILKDGTEVDAWDYLRSHFEN
ncbi:MAG: putative hemolysin [Ruegeria sp.]